MLVVIRRSVLRIVRANFRVIAPGQHNSFQRNVAAVASRWQHRVQFDRPEIWTSDLPLQRRTRYRSTNSFFATQTGYGNKCMQHANVALTIKRQTT